MNKNTTPLETVNENLVFSEPIADSKVNVNVSVNDSSILDSDIDAVSSGMRTDAADSVASFVDTSNSSITVVDLSNSSSSIIDISNSNSFIPITDISKNVSVINTHVDINNDNENDNENVNENYNENDNENENDNDNDKDISKHEPVKPVGKNIIKFNEPSTIELIENRDQKKLDSDTVVSKISDVVEDITEDLLNSVLDKVKESLGDLGVKPSTLPKIIQFVMEAIEDTPTKGPAQKDFAVKVIGSLIDELHDSDEKKLLQETFKSGGIEGTIDLVVSATKGELNINQVVDVAVNSCICPVFNFSMSKFKSCNNKTYVKNSVKV